MRVGATEAEEELAVGFRPRYERATPGEREYLRAMADVSATEGHGDPDLESVSTADVAKHPGASRSPLPARDALLKKGLSTLGARPDRVHGPHFGKYLREHTPDRTDGLAAMMLK